MIIQSCRSNSLAYTHIYSTTENNETIDDITNAIYFLYHSAFFFERIYKQERSIGRVYVQIHVRRRRCDTNNRSMILAY